MLPPGGAGVGEHVEACSVTLYGSFASHHHVTTRRRHCEAGAVPVDQSRVVAGFMLQTQHRQRLKTVKREINFFLHSKKRSFTREGGLQPQSFSVTWTENTKKRHLRERRNLFFRHPKKLYPEGGGSQLHSLFYSLPLLVFEKVSYFGRSDFSFLCDPSVIVLVVVSYCHMTKAWQRSPNADFVREKMLSSHLLAWTRKKRKKNNEN